MLISDRYTHTHTQNPYVCTNEHTHTYTHTHTPRAYLNQPDNNVSEGLTDTVIMNLLNDQYS